MGYVWITLFFIIDSIVTDINEPYLWRLLFLTTDVFFRTKLTRLELIGKLNRKLPLEMGQ